MKIINVLKEDSFEEILELFRQAPEGEVFLVLPRNGKLFRREDHFAVFASEAKQGRKSVSLLTSNAATAALARKFGFTAIASQKTGSKPVIATKTTAPPPADPDIREENDDAFSDVPMTSDATMGHESIDSVAGDVDPLRNMQVLDEDGNPVDENQDGKTDKADPDELAIADSQSDFNTTAPDDTSALLASTTRAASVPTPPRELDYIDAMWRDKVGQGASSSYSLTPRVPSFVSRTLAKTGRAARGTAFPKKVAAGILLVALVVLGGVVYATTGSAHVALAPVGKVLDTQITIEASDTFASVDDAFLKIPGQLLDVSKTATKTAPATGNRDVASKARGKITVHNEFSSSPQTLVATTRFQAPGGQVFRTLQTITVPGSRVSSGQPVAGTVVVDVIADKPGTEYNIPAGKFVIMAFVEKGEAEKAKQFYGVSEQAMAGGASGPSSVITQADYDAAQTAAVAAVKEQFQQALLAQGPALMVLQGDEPVMQKDTSTAQVDDAATEVAVTATGTLKTIAFRGEDLQELIRTYILKKDRLVVLPEKLELSYTDITFKPELSTLSFVVTVKGTGYTPVDIEAIKKDIAGKNTQSIRDYFKDKEGVRSATVTLSPFWVRSVPQKQEKITVELQYDDISQ